MRFSEKLVCTILLVVVTFFALGGSALLYGDFRDRLSASAVQEQNSHSMICYTLESEMLTLHRQGEAVTAEVLREFCAELLETEDNTTTQLAALYRTDGETAEGAVYSSMPAVWGKKRSARQRAGRGAAQRRQPVAGVRYRPAGRLDPLHCL